MSADTLKNRIITTLAYTAEAGFSLIELLVIMVVMGVLFGIGTYAFSQLRVKTQVETQVRQMSVDLGAVRVRALTTKQKHAVKIYADKYVFASYSSEDEPLTSGTVISGGTHQVKYQMKKSPSVTYSGETYEIDKRGLMDTGSFANNTIPVYLTYVGGAVVDCLNLRYVQANIGKTTVAGDKCEDK